jgi:hypothetical protein
VVSKRLEGGEFITSTGGGDDKDSDEEETE